VVQWCRGTEVQSRSRGAVAVAVAEMQRCRYGGVEVDVQSYRGAEVQGAEVMRS
jgi:hypothetical protein